MSALSRSPANPRSPRAPLGIAVRKSSTISPPSNAGVFDGGEIVDDFRTAIPSGARGERGFAGERDKADIFQRFRDDEVQMPPAMGDAEDGYFVGANGKVLGNAFRERGEGNLRGIARFAVQGVCEAFQLCCEIHIMVQKPRRATCG